MRSRRSIARCSADDRARWRDAIAGLSERESVFGPGDRLDDFVELYAASELAFEGPARLPAMRVLLFHLETELRARGAHLPYWEFGRGRLGDPLALPASFDRAALGRRLDEVALPEPRDLGRITDYSELWPVLRELERAVAGAIGGVIASPRAPADPAFWLVGAAIDRLWWTWSRRLAIAQPYRSDQALPGARWGDPLRFDPRRVWWTGAPTPASVIDSHALLGEGVAYDTDDPELAIEGPPLLSFGSMVIGERRRRSVPVMVESARPLRLSLVERSPGPWRSPNGPVVPVLADAGVWTPARREIVLEVEPERLGVERGQVVVEATVDDPDPGFEPWFPEPGPRALARWVLELVVEAIRPARAWGLVVDRSALLGWCGDEAEAAAIVRGLAESLPGLVDAGDEVIVVERTPESNVDAELERLAQADVDRRALIAVGDGRPMVPTFADVRTSRIVLHGLDDDTGPIDDERARFVPRSEGLLGALASLAEAAAEVRGVQTVHVGAGTLGWGSVHRCAVHLDRADERIEVEVLSGLAPLLEVRLFDPSGTRIACEPTAAGIQAKLLRHRLDGGVSGSWTVELELADEAQVQAWLRGGEVAIDHLARHRVEGGLPYRLTLRVRSGLELRLEPQRVRCREGGAIEVEARLEAHGLQVEGQLAFAATLQGRAVPVEPVSDAVVRVRTTPHRSGPGELVVTVRGRTKEGQRVLRTASQAVFVVSDGDTAATFARAIDARDRKWVEWLLQRIETGEIAAASIKRLEKLGVDVVGALQAFVRDRSGAAEPTRRTSGLSAWMQRVGTSLLSVDPKVLFEAVRPRRPLDEE